MRPEKVMIDGKPYLIVPEEDWDKMRMESLLGRQIQGVIDDSIEASHKVTMIKEGELIIPNSARATV